MSTDSEIDQLVGVQLKQLVGWRRSAGTGRVNFALWICPVDSRDTDYYGMCHRPAAGQYYWTRQQTGASLCQQSIMAGLKSKSKNNFKKTTKTAGYVWSASTEANRGEYLTELLNISLTNRLNNCSEQVCRRVSPHSAPCSVWTLCSISPPHWCQSARGVSCKVPEEKTVF